MIFNQNFQGFYLTKGIWLCTQNRFPRIDGTWPGSWWWKSERREEMSPRRTFSLPSRISDKNYEIREEWEFPSVSPKRKSWITLKFTTPIISVRITCLCYSWSPESVEHSIKDPYEPLNLGGVDLVTVGDCGHIVTVLNRVCDGYLGVGYKWLCFTEKWILIIWTDNEEYFHHHYPLSGKKNKRRLRLSLSVWCSKSHLLYPIHNSGLIKSCRLGLKLLFKWYTVSVHIIYSSNIAVW